MGCNLLLNIFICSGIKLFRIKLGLVLPLQGMPLTIATLVISSLMTYFTAKTFGKIGGIVLAVLGIVGALFSLGTTLILTIIGVLMVFWSNAAKTLVIINAVLFALCLFGGCL
jgi:hypothetical protein